MVKLSKPAAVLAVIVMMVSGAVVLGGCGSSSSSSSVSTGEGGDGSTGATGAVPAAVTAHVKQLLKGEYQPIPTSSPPPQKGKTIWQISCGQAFESCAEMSESVKEAGEALGWSVNVVDGKAEPSTASSLIKQAVAAHADGITIFAFDCPGIKAALEEAKAAHIPVVQSGGLDCNDPVFGGGEELFARTVYYDGSKTVRGFQEGYAKARADAIIAHLGGNGKIISLEEQSQAKEKINNEAFNKEISTQCPECEVIEVPFTYANVAKAQQIWQAAIQANPDAEVLSSPADALMTLGLQAAIQRAGRSENLWVMGEAGGGPNLELIREGKQGGALALDGYRWDAWGAVDTLNRIFAGETEFPNEGGGYTLVENEHNLPPEGQPFEPPINFAAEFEKLWENS